MSGDEAKGIGSTPAQSARIRSRDESPVEALEPCTAPRQARCHDRAPSLTSNLPNCSVPTTLPRSGGHGSPAERSARRLILGSGSRPNPASIRAEAPVGPRSTCGAVFGAPAGRMPGATTTASDQLLVEEVQPRRGRGATRTRRAGGICVASTSGVAFSSLITPLARPCAIPHARGNLARQLGRMCPAIVESRESGQ
jgi:hypothetical protein